MKKLATTAFISYQVDEVFLSSISTLALFYE
jgi:hypothetical protein